MGLKKDPSKELGIIKEQIELENISRRRFPDKWGYLARKDINYLYNQDQVNMLLRKDDAQTDSKEISAYTYTGHGDSYFVSKDMYESLVAKCRCGRRRNGGHTIKCLQKVQSKYLEERALSPSSSMAPGDEVHNERSRNTSDDDSRFTHDNTSHSHHPSTRNGGGRLRIPETSNGMIGWVKCNYLKWEQSTKYVSPIATMPGYKVTEHPYNVILIG